MTIVRWSPFPEIEAFDRRMRRMLDEVGIAPAAIPAADVYETDKEFTFEPRHRALRRTNSRSR